MKTIPKAETIDAVLAREKYWKDKKPATKRVNSVLYTAVYSAPTR